MTTTPTIWKAKFNPNFAALAGGQSGPQTIGLANGNILTVWEDDTNGPSPGHDIMGQLFDPNGNPIGTPFQVNSGITNNDETAPSIAALPDGGYVVAYGSYDSSDGGFIVVERFNSSGAEVTYHTITDGRSSLTNWDLTVDSNGNYLIDFERDVEYVSNGIFGESHYWSKNVDALIYNNVSNNPRPEFSAGQNSGDYQDYLGDVATFTDGNEVTVSFEHHPNDEFGWDEVTFRIATTGTGQTVVGATHIAGSDSLPAASPDVAVLTGGQFVVVYEYLGSGTGGRNVDLRIVANDAPGTAPGAEIVVGTPSDDSVHSPRVVALNDGGFYVVWNDYAHDALVGTRFSAAGGVIGTANVQIATGVAQEYIGTLSLTSDGRILVPFSNSSHEISEVIVDPRDNQINGTNAGEVLTSQVGDSVVHGNGGNDTLWGQAGADTLYGDGGEDTIYGQAGIDTLIGGPGNDTYFLADVNEVDLVLRQDVNGVANQSIIAPFKSYAYDTVIENSNEGVDTVHVLPVTNGTSYALPANVENGIIDGSSAFFLQGNDLHNVLTGNNSANTLDGGAGADAMYGELGDDTYVVDDTGDVVTEFANEGTDTVQTTLNVYTLPANVENLTFTGTGSFSGFGNALANTITGGAGADTMAGGLGNDTYVVDNAGDVVTENPGEGTDTVRTTLSLYTLPANVENLTFTDSAAHTGNGNDLGNVMTGGTGNDSLNGGAGGDIMIGGTGDDTYFVDNVGDLVIENAGEGNDIVHAIINYTLPANVESLVLDGGTINGAGNADNNAIIGNAADNNIDGRGGADLMQGGAGNDVYFVDNPGDSVIENAGEGNDVVHATIDYTIGANIESLVLDGITVNGAGNSDDNAIIGNAANNILDGHGGADFMQGGAGDDIYFVDNPGDAVVENPGEGNDIVHATIDYTLGANIESLILDGTAINGAGNADDNAIIGNAANNIIDGRGGADLMQGGAGDDIYFVDNPGDAVIENPGEGNDIVHATIDYTIGANIESLVLDGTADLNGAGNADNNALIGNSGANNLDGRGGADFLIGNGGNDTFEFHAGEANGDLIADFDANGDADQLLFLGYGTAAQGATFTQVDASHWSINSFDGAVHDVIGLQNGAAVGASDYAFV